jgi:glycine dehydrogenase subunit 2
VPDSIGKLHAFWGNFGVLVRAYTYIIANGDPGCAWSASTRC